MLFAVKVLFRELTENGFQYPETNKESKTWKDFLPQSYWHFGKKCSFKFKPSPGCYPYFHIEISTPIVEKEKPYFFNEEGYGKYLLGNGSSIPVIEHVLRPLEAKCTERKRYDKFDDVFQWSAHLGRATQSYEADEASV